MPVDAKRLQAVFLGAVDLAEPQARAAYLDRECGTDAELRQRVERLLAAHDDSAELPSAHAPTQSYESAADEHLASGALFAGRYKLRERLAEGGMGVVYVADQVEPVQRRVALKLIRANLSSETLLARFEQERQALALMDHPNIAKVFDAGVADGTPYFVMELIKGVPLTKYCDESKLTPRQRLELIIPVCQAVQHAHQKGIIHRDLKPSNIIVGQYDGRPVPKVIDFGVAKMTGPRLTEHSVYTEVGSVIGTLEYMSPEQAELDNFDIDTRADVYALGVILYELLTGTVPFSRRDLESAGFVEMLRVIKEQEPPKPSTRLSASGSLPSIAACRHTEPVQLPRLIRGELDWIVMKCLEKDRGRRYDSANGLGMDIQRYLSDEPVAASPPSRRYRFGKWCRKNRTAVYLGALTAACIATVACNFIIASYNARRERDYALVAAEAERQQRAEAERQRDRAALAENEAAVRRDQAMSEKHRADEEARVSRAVERFLHHDLLTQADSRSQVNAGFSADPGLTVKEALNRSAQHLDDRFRDQPQVQAAIRSTIGRTYLGIGEPQLALPHLERSRQLRAAAAASDPLAVIRSESEAARAYLELRQTAKALQLSENTLDKARRLLGPQHTITVSVVNLVALALIDADRPADAARLLEDTLADSDRLASDEEFPGLSIRGSLAIAYERLGRLADAIQLTEHVWRERRARQGPTHPDTLLAMNNLGTAYWRNSQPERAIPLFEDSLRERTKSLGPDHPLVIRNQVNLGMNYRAAGRAADAIRVLSDARDRARRVPQLKSLAAGPLLDELAEAYTAVGDHARAEPLFREILAANRGPAEATASWQARLGLNLLQQGRHADAEPLIREALKVREQKEPNDWRTFNTKSLLGGALLGQMRLADAEPLLRDGYEGMKQRATQIPKDGKPRLEEALERLVHLYEALNKPDQAAKLRAELNALKATPTNKP